MSDLLTIILSIGALLTIGLICSFFVILNTAKEELWSVIHERNYEENDTGFQDK